MLRANIQEPSRFENENKIFEKKKKIEWRKQQEKSCIFEQGMKEELDKRNKDEKKNTILFAENEKKKN